MFVGVLRLTFHIPHARSLKDKRHVVRKFPLRYDPLYWGAVFPLGMYTVATVRLSQAVEVPELMGIAHAFVFVAIAAWAATLVGLARALTSTSD